VFLSWQDSKPGEAGDRWEGECEDFGDVIRGECDDREGEVRCGVERCHEKKALCVPLPFGALPRASDLASVDLSVIVISATGLSSLSTPSPRRTPEFSESEGCDELENVNGDPELPPSPPSR